MKRLIMKSKNSLWPTVIWKESQLLVYYLGENEDNIKVRETREIDFEEFFLHLDNGGSVFVTMKPCLDPHECDCPPASEVPSELLQDYV
jgi:hypothetical protein